jgi:hypothetical protein
MTILAKRNIDITIEKKIATAAIISKKFLQEIKPVYDSNYIKGIPFKIILLRIINNYKSFYKTPNLCF